MKIPEDFRNRVFTQDACSVEMNLSSLSVGCKMSNSIFDAMKIFVLIIFVVSGFILGLMIGVFLGGKGVVACPLAGGFLGFFLWYEIITYMKKVALRKRSSEELKAFIRDENCNSLKLILEILRGRSQVSWDDLDIIVTMLSSQNRTSRVEGWAALTWAFPELAELAPDYGPLKPLEKCLESIRPLSDELAKRKTSLTPKFGKLDPRN